MLDKPKVRLRRIYGNASDVSTGLGMHLQQLAQRLPEKRDLSSPDVRIQDLSISEHLRRVFRICEIHFMRNIRQSAVPENVQDLMRSLVCLEHPDMEQVFFTDCRVRWKSRAR